MTYDTGPHFGGVSGVGSSTVPGADHFGEVQAWNVDTGQKAWTHNYAKTPNWGSMLTTGGGLVFSGGTNDRKIHAFDAATGKLLWESDALNSGILAPPPSFLIDGKQYIAVHSGWGGDCWASGDAQSSRSPESIRRCRPAAPCTCLHSNRSV